MTDAQFSDLINLLVNASVCFSLFLGFIAGS